MGERIRSAGPATRWWPRRVRSSPRDGRRRSKRLLRRRPSPGRPPTGTSRANEPSWRAAHPETAVESLLPDDAPDDVAARLDIVVAAYTRIILDNESQQRTMLRLSLEADPEERSQLPLRQGRVIKWLEEALAPLQPQLPRSEVRRLAIAIRSATGIEALSWLTDVAGLSREDAAALMRWSAHAMLDATTAGLSGTRRKRSRGRPGAASSP